MTGIYIASKTIHAERWRNYRRDCIPIISTWIDEAGVGESADLSDLWCRCIAEAMEADILVAYQAPGEVWKGAFIEIGAALAAQKPVLVVGPNAELSFAKHPLVKTGFEQVFDALMFARNYCYQMDEARDIIWGPK